MSCQVLFLLGLRASLHSLQQIHKNENKNIFTITLLLFFFTCVVFLIFNQGKSLVAQKYFFTLGSKDPEG